MTGGLPGTAGFPGRQLDLPPAVITGRATVGAPDSIRVTPGGDEQPANGARARMTKPSSAPQTLKLLRLGPGHFAANIDLEPGRVSFAIDATAGRTRYDGGFDQLIR